MILNKLIYNELTMFGTSCELYRKTMWKTEIKFFFLNSNEIHNEKSSVSEINNFKKVLSRILIGFQQQRF